MCSVIAALALVGSACGSDDSSSDGALATTAPPDEENRPLVIATTTILGDLTENVVGDLADVEVIMPSGADPHDFEPSAQQAADLREADMIIANGLYLEEGLVGPLEQAHDEGIPVVEIAPKVDPIPWDDEPENNGHEDDHDHHHGEEDPHFWMDPQRVAMAAEVISEELSTQSDLDAERLSDQAGAYSEELAGLDDALSELFSEISDDDRKIITNHDAFGYLADRYGFEIIGTVVPEGTTLAEPSAAALAELADLIEAEEVPAIFTETISPTELAETLAAETGADVEIVELFSDSLGEPGTEGDTYISMMTLNAERIVEALT